MGAEKKHCEMGNGKKERKSTGKKSCSRVNVTSSMVFVVRWFGNGVYSSHADLML